MGKKNTSAALRSFQGLKGVLKQVQKEKPEEVAPLPPDPVPEPESQPDGRRPSDIMPIILRRMKEQRYSDALGCLLSLSELTTIPFKARAQIAPLSNVLRRLARHQAGTGAGLSKLVHEKSLKDAEELVSNLNIFFLEGDEKLEAHVTVPDLPERVELPSDVHRPVLIHDVKLIVSAPPGKVLEGKGIRYVSSGVYWITCSLVGVPDSGDRDKNLAAATRYAMKKIKAEPHPIAITRPDNFAVWYPITRVGILIANAVFPDQVRRHTGLAYEQSALLVQSRRSAQKNLRLKFEMSEKDLIDSLSKLKTRQSELSKQIADNKDLFETTYGVAVTIPDSKLEKATKRRMDEAVEGLSDFAARLSAKLAMKTKLDEAKAARLMWLKLKAEFKSNRASIKEGEKDLSERKAEFRYRSGG